MQIQVQLAATVTATFQLVHVQWRLLYWNTLCLKTFLASALIYGDNQHDLYMSDQSDQVVETICCILSVSTDAIKPTAIKTPVPNRAVGAYWGRHGHHQQGHERGREESDRHGPVLWSVCLADQEVGLVSGIRTTGGVRNPYWCPVPLNKFKLRC